MEAFVPTKYRCPDCQSIVFSSYPKEFVTCPCFDEERKTGMYVDQSYDYTRLGGFNTHLIKEAQ